MRQGRQAGVTLIELGIACAVLTMIVGGAYALLGTGVSTYGTGTSAMLVERRSAEVLEQISDEITQSGRNVLYPTPKPPGSSSRITLQRNAGFAEGDIAWSPTTIFEFRYDPGDPNDGKDNNGNGLIDEGIIVRRDNAGREDECVTVLTRWVREYLEGEEPNGKDDNGNGLVDESGLCFDVSADVWTIRITLERIDPNRRRVTHTTQTSTKARN